MVEKEIDIGILKINNIIIFVIIKLLGKNTFNEKTVSVLKQVAQNKPCF